MQYSSHTKVYLTNFPVGLNVLHLPSHALFTRQATNRAALLDVTECDVWMASSWTRLTKNDMCTMFTSCLRGLNNASSNTTWKKIAGMKTVDCYTLWQWHCWQHAIVWIWDTLGIQSPWLLILLMKALWSFKMSQAISQWYSVTTPKIWTLSNTTLRNSNKLGLQFYRKFAIKL
jgi:hypothetical protein